MEFWSTVYEALVNATGSGELGSVIRKLNSIRRFVQRGSLCSPLAGSRSLYYFKDWESRLQSSAATRGSTDGHSRQRATKVERTDGRRQANDSDP